MRRYYFITIFSVMIFQLSCISTPSEADECFAIEAARCEMRGRCYDSFDVEGCKYYYEEQCRTHEIKVEFTADDISACVDSIYEVNPNGNSPAQCQMLDDAEFESELCIFDAFSPCHDILCNDGSDDTEVDDDTSTDTEVSSGLNP